MIVPPVVQHWFTNAAPYVDIVEQRVDDLLLNYCKGAGFSYSSRSKAVDSLAEKIESGRYRRWSEIDDLFACTIVVPTLSSEPAVLAFLKSAFRQESVRKRGSAEKSPDTFRFDSTRFVGRLNAADGLSLPSEVYKVLFEVQIRSAFEHAWCVTTHALTYKASSLDWRRLRLAAQLKAAVEQLDLMILTFEQSAQSIPASMWPELATKQKIGGFFQNQVESGGIPSEAAPKDWSRFCENVFGLLRSCSQWPDGRAGQRRFVSDALAILGTEIEALGQSSFPRSISLFQFVLGILTNQSHLGSELQGFTPLITAELSLLYPEVGSHSARFEFDW